MRRRDHAWAASFSRRDPDRLNCRIRVRVAQPDRAPVSETEDSRSSRLADFYGCVIANGKQPALQAGNGRSIRLASIFIYGRVPEMDNGSDYESDVLRVRVSSRPLCRTVANWRAACPTSRTMRVRVSRPVLLTMGYKDKEIQRRYQREWRQKRYDDWVAANGPCIDCGSWSNLEVDHMDPSQKVSHRIWSWRKERRDIELLKCKVRCRLCHVEKTRLQQHGTPKHGRMKMYKCT